MRVLLFFVTYCTAVHGVCQYHVSDSLSNEVESKLKQWNIYGKNFSVTEGDTSYSLGICQSPVNVSSQIAIQQKEKNSVYTLGVLNQVNLIVGSNFSWILLTYENGDAYGEECENASRTASIMFVCGAAMNTPIVLQKHTSNDHHCNYMFELHVPGMCPTVSSSKKMSGGAVFLIVLFSVASVYLVGGFLFMHIKRGARGLDRIPNLRMWRNLGNLAADGCDFCCRCEMSVPRPGYILDESEPDMRVDDDILSP